VVQHAWLLAPRWLLQLGNRAEYYAEDGVVLVPRAALRWQPATGTTLRATSGAGYRPVTIFSLEEAVEAGFDRVVLSDDLAAERSQSYSLGLNRAWSFNAQTLSLDLAAFYTNFDRKVVVQLGESAGEALYRMSHAAFSRSVEVQARWTHERGWRLKAGGTRSDVRYRIDGRTHNAELQYAWTGDAAVGKNWRQGWDAELAASVFGPQFLPEGRVRKTSPAYVLWDTELRKNWGAFSTSLIVRNLFNWTQSDNPYQRDPRSGRLVPDAALFYGPVLGRTVHVGVSYAL
jgi:outer membrane receptor protein involved in Fe transport